MAVPKTTMNKNDLPTPRKYEVGFTWKIFTMETITEA